MHARREEKKLSDNTRNAPYLMIPSNFCIPVPKSQGEGRGEGAARPWTAQPPRARGQAHRCCRRSLARPPGGGCVGTVKAVPKEREVASSWQLFNDARTRICGLCCFDGGGNVCIMGRNL